MAVAEVRLLQVDEPGPTLTETVQFELTASGRGMYVRAELEPGDYASRPEIAHGDLLDSHLLRLDCGLTELSHIRLVKEVHEALPAQIDFGQWQLEDLIFVVFGRTFALGDEGFDIVTPDRRRDRLLRRLA